MTTKRTTMTKLTEFERLQQRADRYNCKLLRSGSGYRLKRPGEKPGRRLTAAEVRVTLQGLELLRKCLRLIQQRQRWEREA